MNKRWAFFLVLTSSVVSSLTTLAGAGDAAWVEIKSPHFSVYTDAGEKRGREVATRFEQMRVVFGQLMTQAKVNTPIPLEIVAFRNAKELRQVSPLWNGKPVELAGLFQGGSDRCFIMLDMSTENPWSTVFHEYAHQLMNGTISFQLDPWFEEGFAEYFSSIEVDSHQANVGKLPQMTYDILRQEGMMKVADLFKVQHDSSTYNETGDKRTVFYAESSMVVHYLYDNDLFPKLARYFELKYNNKMSVEDSIQQAFGMSAANFHKAIYQYASSGRSRYYFMKTPPEVETTGYTSRPVSATEAAAVVADIHAHSRDYQAKAVSEFEEVLKADPDNATANRGLGYSYLQKRDFEKAQEYFQRAAKGDPNDARVHYYSGVLLNTKGSLSDSDLSFMTSELNKSIALDPDFADSYMQLAYAQSRAANLDAAIASAKKAISLNPRNQGYYFNVAGLYLQKGKHDDALSIYRALSKSSDPMTASRASAMAEQIEQVQASTKELEGYRRSSEESAEASSPSTLKVRESSSPQTATTSNSSLDGEQSPQVHLTPAPKSSQPPSPTTASMKFLKGTILSVDCTSSPGALLTLSSGGKRWLMQVGDTHHVLVLGGNGFSCDWKSQKVALNYRETGDSSGTVVSIEIQ